MWPGHVLHFIYSLLTWKQEHSTELCTVCCVWQQPSKQWLSIFGMTRNVDSTERTQYLKELKVLKFMDGAFSHGCYLCQTYLWIAVKWHERPYSVTQGQQCKTVQNSHLGQGAGVGLWLDSTQNNNKNKSGLDRETQHWLQDKPQLLQVHHRGHREPKHHRLIWQLLRPHVVWAPSMSSFLVLFVMLIYILEGAWKLTI